MKKEFLDLCYDIIRRYTSFPDVAGTAKDISDGIGYAQCYQQNQFEFSRKYNEIVSFIIKVRANNIIDSYQDDKNYLALVPVPSGKPLGQSTPEELFSNLISEINRLVVKGIHQTIKHIYPDLDDIELLKKLLPQEISVLQEYGLLSQTERAQ